MECAESQWTLKAETVTTLSSLVKVIKVPWERQFGVELQKNLYPSITVRLGRNYFRIMVVLQLRLLAVCFSLEIFGSKGARWTRN